MITRWIGPALVAGWLGATSLASAQCGHHPTPIGPARMPEPVPCLTPDLVPGPINPLAAPAGPPPEFTLPAGHSGAFQCENCAPTCNLYFHLGSQSLQRASGLGKGALAVFDPGLGGV